MKEKNFFKKAWTSITDFEAYEDFAINNISKTILYIMILTFIFTLAVTIANIVKVNIVVGEAKSYINETIEEITYKNGKLEVKTGNPIIIENEENVIPILIVDTKTYEDSREEKSKIDEYEAKIKAYQIGAVILKDKILVRSPLLSEGITEIKLDTILDIEINNKQDLLNQISGKNLAIISVTIGLVMLIYLYTIYLITILIDILILGIIGMIFARIAKLRLKYKAAWNIGAHAITLPVLLNLIYIIVNLFTAFEIKYFQWMYTSISYIYVVVAILMIKTEIINKRLELIKLEQIQKQEAQNPENEPKEEEPKEENKEQNKDEEEEKTKETRRNSRRFKRLIVGDAFSNLFIENNAPKK